MTLKNLIDVLAPSEYCLYVIYDKNKNLILKGRLDVLKLNTDSIGDYTVLKIENTTVHKIVYSRIYLDC